jgi:soluble lytic murein transglycosylase-like protein
MIRVLKFGFLLGLALACTSGFAGDVAVLQNGSAIRHEWRQTLGIMTRLYTSQTDFSSYVDIPTAQIDHFEKDETPSASAAIAPAASTSASSNLNALAKPAVVPALKPGRPHVLTPEELQAAVNAASDKHLLDADLINSVIRAESGFNVRAVSPKGAQGLMQLMPQTATNLGVGNAFDAKDNVDGGTRYLRWLLERYNYDLVKALAAYNAGPRRVEQYRGVPPYHETRAYVARIIRDYNHKKLAEQKATASGAHVKAKANARSQSRPTQSAEAEPLPPSSTASR